MVHFTNPLTSTPTPIFPTYLLPSLPFRRRKSSTDSTGTDSSYKSTASIEEEPPNFLTGSSSLLRCAHCLADLCPISSIISKGFTGRHGRAYLVAPPAASLTQRVRHLREVGNLPNTSLDKAVPRQLVTGQHTVADIRCKMCDMVLGWKYVAAEEEGQRYKVGKFILETRRIVKGVDWEGEGSIDEAVEEAGGVNSRRLGKGKAFDPGNGSEDDIEFDSQDEDECEDLFNGLWTPALARKRRAKKLIWKRDADVDMV